MMQTITPKTFEAFGKRSCEPNLNTSKIYDGVVHENSIETTKYFVNECIKILNGHYTQVNSIAISKILNMMYQNGFEYMTNILIEIMTIHTTDIAKKIQYALDTNTFEINEFITEHNKYVKNSSILRNCLINFDCAVTLENSKVNPSYIHLIKSYIFYANVINKRYNCKDTELYLYEIISKYLDPKMDMHNLIAIFKIYNFYNRLSQIVKSDKEKYFNTELVDKLLIKDGDLSQQFLSMIIADIDVNIKELYNLTDAKIAGTKLQYIRDQITVGSNFINDKTLFMVMYRAQLSDRLMSENINPLIEKELLTSLNYKNEPDIYAKMVYQINDAAVSIKHNINYQQLNINITSAKYKEYDISKLNKKICKFNVYKSYAWDITSAETINMPLDAAIYVDIFNVYYREQYKDRVLSCMYDKSTITIKMELNGKSYNIHMTLAQYIVLNLINERVCISAVDIARTLGTGLKRLNTILNNLICSRLINREQGPSTDPTIPFKINNAFTYPTEKISLVKLLRKPLAPNSDSQTAEKSMPSATNIKALIIGIMVNNTEIEKSALIEQLNKRTGCIISSEIVTSMVNDFIKMGKILETSTTYQYIKSIV